MQKKKTNTLWLLQKIKTLCTRSKFQGCLYQRRVLTLSNGNRQKPLDQEQFCFVFPGRLIAGFGFLVVMTVPLAVSNSPIKFEHEFASQRFFCFATGCWRGYDRNFGRELWKEIYMQAHTSTNIWLAYAHLNNVFVHNFFFNKKSPKKCTPTDDRELASKPLVIARKAIYRACCKSILFLYPYH